VKSATTPTTKFTLREDGIVLGLDINPEVPRTGEIVAAAFDELAQLIGGEARPGLWDARLARDFPPQAWSTLISLCLSAFRRLRSLRMIGSGTELEPFPPR
jgi:hypothetical protein